MKFSSLAVFALMSSLASGFAPVNLRQNAYKTTLQKSNDPYDFEGLEKIEFPKPDSTPAAVKEIKKKAKKVAKEVEKAAPEPKPVGEVKKQTEKVTKKAEKVTKEVEKAIPKPSPPKPEPFKNKKITKPELPAPKPTPIAPKIESLKPKTPKQKLALKPPPPKPKRTDSNAVPLGIALGGAPLLLAPIIALGAGRDLLSKTKARRDELQKEIEEAEKAKAARKLQAQADPGGIAQALVSQFLFIEYLF